MTAFNKDQYLEQLQMYYSGEEQDREQFLHDMEDSLDCYLSEHPDAAEDEIYQLLGHPDELRQEFQQKQDQMQITRREHTRKSLIAAFLIAAIITLGCFTHLAYKQIVDSSGEGKISTYTSDIDATAVPAITNRPEPIWQTDESAP